MLGLKRVLLPVDFSERSLGAARYVEALAARCDCDVTLLHVLPLPHYEFSALEIGGTVLNELYGQRTARVRDELNAFLADELRGLRVERVLLEGDPACKVVEYAHDHHVQVILMPTHGYGPFRRFILGSVTAKVLHDADCAVWTGVHLEQAPEFHSIQFQTIVAALDMGPQSRRTLEWAWNIATEFKARLVAVSVIPCLEASSGEYYDTDWRTHMEERCRKQVAELQGELGSGAELVIESGDPPTAICGAASRLGADVLIIGRGSAAGRFGRLRANAYSIIRQSPCPVVSV
jgi:nucleotide-binding universal stress UspA family protein